jgi:ABC-2 type transport system ATP-binding protein
MLEIRDLHRRYGEVVALDGASFTVGSGQVVGFVGRNGAGKTTTMRVVMGVVRPDRGEVTWHGSPVDGDVRLRFGYMPEERGLYPKMRVRDQLIYLARMSGLDREDARRNTDRWLERLGVDADRADGVVEELSLGNQQRVQLAAALVHQPELLVLDEPFSGLDPVGVDVLAEALHQEAARGVGIVFSSHQLELVERLCDEVVIIEAGRIVTGDTAAPDELRETPMRVRIEVVDATDGWLDGLPGVEQVDRDGDRWVVSLHGVTGLDALVDAARMAGSIRHLEVLGSTLSERFRAAVER